MSRNFAQLQNIEVGEFIQLQQMCPGIYSLQQPWTLSWQLQYLSYVVEFVSGNSNISFSYFFLYMSYILHLKSSMHICYILHDIFNKFELYKLSDTVYACSKASSGRRLCRWHYESDLRPTVSYGRRAYSGWRRWTRYCYLLRNIREAKIYTVAYPTTWNAITHMHIYKGLLQSRVHWLDQQIESYNSSF